VKGTPEVFKKISSAGSLFLSRSDKSGTHSKEMAIWKAAELTRKGKSGTSRPGLGWGRLST